MSFKTPLFDFFARAPLPEPPPPPEKKEGFISRFFKKLEDLLSGANPKEDQALQEKLEKHVFTKLEEEKKQKQQLKIAEEKAQKALMIENQIWEAAQEGRLLEHLSKLTAERRAQQAEPPSKIKSPPCSSPPSPSSSTRPPSPNRGS